MTVWENFTRTGTAPTLDKIRVAKIHYYTYKRLVAISTARAVATHALEKTLNRAKTAQILWSGTAAERAPSLLRE